MGKPITGRPKGNPQKFIDWDMVDFYLKAHCLGTEIADFLGIHPDTLYKRCVDEHGTIWSEYVRRGNSSGKLLIRATQFEVAIKKKDRVMLQYLGKHILNQKDNVSADDIKMESEFKQFLDIHKEMVPDTIMNEDISTKVESKEDDLEV